MGFFNFFKKEQQNSVAAEKFWELTTNDEEIIDPTWEQVKLAIEYATSDVSFFASLGYIHADLEIELIQAMGENGIYRFEAIPPKSSANYGKLFVDDGITYAEVVSLFETFFHEQKVVGYKNLRTEKIR